MTTKKTAIAKRAVISKSAPVQSKKSNVAKSAKDSNSKVTVAKSNGSAKMTTSKMPASKVPSASINKPKSPAAKVLKPTPAPAVEAVSLQKAAPVSATKVIDLKAAASPVVKPEVFHSGDKVVYPAHGVGAVDSIQSRSIGGSEAKFYMITIMETGMKVMVPVSQATTVGLRKIVDAKTVEKVYDILRDKDVTVQQQTWNRRFREYTQKLKTGSVFEIAKVIRDLSVLKGDKELSFGERKMLDTAQGLLVKELSIAKARSEEIIKAELQQICDA